MITIGIPFYNDEKYLNLAIKSVFSQTYTDWKLILISDGGTDGSLDIARKYESDSRVTLVYDGENKKLPYRLNQLSSMVDTKYYARMDADDIMHPNRIERQLRILKDNPIIDILGTNAYSIDENNEIKGVRMGINNGNFSLVKCSSFIHPSIMGKADWFKKNPYDEKAIRAEDFELWQRTAANSIFKVFTEPLLYYREFGSNYYKKYFDSTRTMLYIATKLKTTKLYINVLLHVMKSIAYYVFWMFNSENTLIEKRRTILSEEDLLVAKSDLNNVIVFH